MDKLWLKSYQAGVPHEINPNEFSSLVELFTESCQKYAASPAFMNMNCNMSYADLDQLSMEFSAYLQSLRLQKGARVALMMPNLLQYPVAIFAILRAGFTVVNINPLYTRDELTYQMNDSGAEVILVLANFADTVAKSLPDMPALKQVIMTEIGDMFPAFKRIIVNAVVKYIKKMLPTCHIPHAITFNQAREIGKRIRKSGPNHPVELTHDDVAFLQYTGGTTGVAKGAILTHGNMLANVLQASSWIAPLSISHHDIVVTALPLYHIFSLTANCLTFLKAGAKNILITNPRDMAGFINEIKHTGFTVITGVNTLYNTLLNHPKFSTIDFSKLKIALSGGMALQKSVSMGWEAKTRSSIVEAYGLTEASPAVTMNPMYMKHYNGSIGLPLPSTDVSIRDPNGCEVAMGEKGELSVSGPQVMLGYWHRKEETAAVFWPDGYLRTGDIVSMDEHGFIYLLDRIKDMILVSGFNVYPNEIEQVISLMPGVLEVGVIGVCEGELAEKVKACIVKRDPSLTAEQVIAFVREHLTAYKVPKIVEFYQALPKTNVGKILKRALR